MSEPLGATLKRLKDERDEADRRYNEALTALDAAVPPHAGIPDPEPALDEHQLAARNEAWNILPAPPAAPSVGAGEPTGGGRRWLLRRYRRCPTPPRWRRRSLCVGLI